MIDYYIIERDLRKKNFTLYMNNDFDIDIIKNEHGTYSEHNDFVVNVKIDKTTTEVLEWVVNLQRKNENYLAEIKGILAPFIEGKNIRFEDLCTIICEKL